MDRRQLFATALAGLSTGLLPVSASAAPGRNPLGFLRTNWSEDPFSFGSYSYVASGARKRDHRVLAEPIADRVFFAGEACHPNYNSTVHAAYESGMMTAEAVSNTNARSVLVIGAGVSGLTAAQTLKTKGYDVTVWEARDRMGGRVWTDRRLGTPLDLGASWIHGDNGNPLIELASDLNLVTTITEDGYVVRGRGGRKLSTADVPDWLEDVVSIQHTAGASRGSINTRAYWLNRDYSGEDVLLPGGYSQLFGALSPELDIELGRIAKRVHRMPDGAIVEDQRDHQMRVDAVIVTVPLGVLKRGLIAFEPPLPATKADAIARLGMGVLDKLYLKYDAVFWDEEATWIATPENDLPPGHFNQWLNLFPYTGEPIIMAFNGAEPARELAKLSDEQIVRLAVKTLDLAYP